MDTDPQARTQYEIIAGDGEIYGPYSLEDLQQYLDEERVQWDTQVRVPGTDDWMPIIRLISPPEVETTAATTTEYEPSVDGGSADINVMDALKKGWGILQKNMGVAIGVFIVGGLLLSISGCLVIPPLLLAGPMVGGLCIFSLKATRGEYVEFGDLFKGFSNFGGFLAAFLLGSLYLGLAALMGFAVMTLIPGSILYFFGPTSIAGIFAILGMVLLVVLPIYITVRYMFAFLLLADGRAGVGESFKMSAAAFRENKGAICLFFVMSILISMIPIIGGPWSVISLAVLYEELFS